MTPKVCSKCGASQPVTSFNRDATKVDGRYSSCKTCSRVTCKRTYRAHHEKHITLKQSWKDENRDRHRQINTAWRKANLARCAAYRAARRASELRATPPWADLASIRKFYEGCPKGWHVDHIDPLRAEDRCGLHTLDNLQYLPAEINFRKNNRTGDKFAIGGEHL